MSTDIARTKTGGFPIGVRRGWSPWQKNDLSGFLGWLKANRLGVADLGNDADVLAPQASAAGLRLGSVDLPDWKGMLSPDPAARAAAVEKNAAYVAAVAAHAGPSTPINHFVVMIPEDAARPREENFSHLVESYNRLAPTLEKHEAKVVVEGWPGEGVLCCTPEGYGEFFRRCPSPALGINYDPSHLVRMGIDPLRFLREFAGRVFHVHGKDTALDAEALYRYGREQQATFAKKPAFGEMAWRYVIPGKGASDWPALLAVLAGAGYRGAVSIELEDADHNGTEEGEKQGLLAARDFLERS